MMAILPPIQILVFISVVPNSNSQYLSVESCPFDGESFKRRAELYSCSGGKQYHCMPTNEEPRAYVEFCMNVFSLEAKDGCPYVKSTLGTKPEVGQNNCTSFNEDVCMSGEFIVTNQLYKYPECLLVENYRGRSTSNVNIHTSDTRKTFEITNLTGTKSQSKGTSQGVDTSVHVVDTSVVEMDKTTTKSEEYITTDGLYDTRVENTIPNSIPGLLIASGVAAAMLFLLICEMYQMTQLKRLRKRMKHISYVPSARGIEEVPQEEDETDVYAEIDSNDEYENAGVYLSSGQSVDARDLYDE